jgi:FtsP/CotA-like multicopper oxidase with cupredoxin domain
MDGVGGLSQPHIPVGKTFVYEFDLVKSGTFMCTTRIPTKWSRWPWA